MSQSEEIKAKLDIVEVIREYIPVKAVGANFQALCPFHNEKTPSFVISPDKQVWHCFGCGKGGDVFSFVMEKEGLSFIETLRLLAPKAGVVLKYENPEAYSKRNRLLDILELAAKYYAHLFQSDDGRPFREYLTKRGLKPETIEKWQLGCSPDAWDRLLQFLKSRPLSGQKYSEEEIFAAGLSIKREANSNSFRGGQYDRFRDRLMFPIRDANGNTIAFTARVNPAKEATEKLGKYINSPQTAVYDKSRVLFGLDRAKEAIRKANMAIIVEGQMDVISCHQAGFENVVASSGTALSAEQVALLKRFTSNISLCFDMDSAGQMAADRGIKEVLAQGLNLKVVTLPQGKDPDECLKSDPEGFRQAIQNARPMLEYYFDKVSAGLDLGNLDNKNKVRNLMFPMISLVPNQTEQGYWLKRVSEELGFAESDTREEFVTWKGQQKGSPKPVTPTAASPKAPGREERLSELLLALMIRFPEHLGYVFANIEPEYIAGTLPTRFYKNLVIYYNKTTLLDYSAFRRHLEEAGEGEEAYLDRLALLGEKDFYDFSQEEGRAEIIKIIVELKKFGCQRRLARLEKQIAVAEKEGRSEDLGLLMLELRQLTEELKKINLD